MAKSRLAVSILSALVVSAFSGQSYAVDLNGNGAFPATPVGGGLIDFSTLGSSVTNPVTINDVTFTGSGALSRNSFSGLYNTSGFSLGAPSGGSVRFDFSGAGANTFFFKYGATDVTWTLRSYSATNQLLSTIIASTLHGANNGDYVGVSGVSGIKYAIFSEVATGDYILIDDFVYLLGPLVPSGPTAVDTLASMQRNVAGMKSVFSLLASYVNPGLSYDCSVFDAHGVCIAFSGRYSSTTSSGPEATSGVLTAAYRINPNIRVGGFLEQYATDITSNGVQMNNTNPDFGVFGVWSQSETGEGFKVRAAYRYGNHGVTITRDAIGSAEAGSGNSDLTTQGAQLTVSKGYPLNNTVLASPYVGLRYTNITRNGYTESATATVTTPLTYSTLKQESTSLLLGVNLAAKVASAVSLTGSVGVETDTSQKISNYSASGVADLGSIQFNNDTRRTRAVASAGVAYNIAKTQQVSAQVFFREEAFGSTSTATGMLTYTAGF